MWKFHAIISSQSKVIIDWILEPIPDIIVQNKSGAGLYSTKIYMAPKELKVICAPQSILLRYMREVWWLPSKFKERSCWVTHRWLDGASGLAHDIFKGRLTCASAVLVNYSGSGSGSTNNKFPKLRDPGIREILRSAQLYFLYKLF